MAYNYFAVWMDDNGGNLSMITAHVRELTTMHYWPLIDDWVQRMHINATADADITPGDLDCSVLHTQNCQPPVDGDCENYNPAACKRSFILS